jgi:hypothetical protein
LCFSRFQKVFVSESIPQFYLISTNPVLFAGANVLDLPLERLPWTAVALLMDSERFPLDYSRHWKSIMRVAEVGRSRNRTYFEQIGVSDPALSSSSSSASSSARIGPAASAISMEAATEATEAAGSSSAAAAAAAAAETARIAHVRSYSEKGVLKTDTANTNARRLQLLELLDEK